MIIVVTGAPGTGKSTLAKALGELVENAVLLETDEFYDAIPNLIDPSHPDSREQNENIVRQFSAVTRSLATRHNVIVDGVVGPWMLPIVRHFLPEIHYIVLHPLLQIALQRAADRAEKKVAPDMVEKMHLEFDKYASEFSQHYNVETDVSAPAVLDNLKNILI